VTAATFALGGSSGSHDAFGSGVCGVTKGWQSTSSGWQEGAAGVPD